MVEGEKNPKPIYLVPDILEEIFIRLPSKSILKFRTVSKQWRSILESRSFVERRMNVQKNRKILAAYNCDSGDRPSLLLPESRLEDNEEIVYLHHDAARPSMTCDGLVCFPEPDWIIIVNPSTGQLRNIPSGLDTVSSTLNTRFRHFRGAWLTFFPGDRAMGFGRDKVTGSYKVVRMCFDPVEECEFLDVETGEWQKISPPPYRVDVERKSICVNGSIYWLTIGWDYKILALDLHTQEFHRVSVPVMRVTQETRIVNLDDRLAIAKTEVRLEWILKIWSMDTDKERWSNTYSISLAGVTINPLESTWFTPLTVSNLVNVVFCDNHKRLFKYFTETGEICCLSSDTCVISPYLENLVPLRSDSGHYPDLEIRASRCRLFPKHLELGSGLSKVFKRIGFGIGEFLFTTLVIVGYIWIPL